MNIPTVLSLFNMFLLRMLTVTVHMCSVTVMVRSIIDSPAMNAPCHAAYGASAIMADSLYGSVSTVYSRRTPLPPTVAGVR